MSKLTDDDIQLVLLQDIPSGSESEDGLFSDDDDSDNDKTYRPNGICDVSATSSSESEEEESKITTAMLPVSLQILLYLVL